MKFGVSFIVLTLITLSNCKEDVSKDTHSTLQGSSEETEKSCCITSMTFQMGGNIRTLEFYYDNKELKRVETFENGKNQNSTMVFRHNQEGLLQSFFSGSSIVKYVYDDHDRVVLINGERRLNTTACFYDSLGRMNKQVTSVGGDPVSTRMYFYDPKGQPNKVYSYNQFGVLTTIYELSYDDKINPLRNKGVFLNNMEMMFGYPVGNQYHNVVAFRKIEKKESGDVVEKNTLLYAYNDEGYPVRILRMRNGKPTEMHLSYLCN